MILKLNMMNVIFSKRLNIDYPVPTALLFAV